MLERIPVYSVGTALCGFATLLGLPLSSVAAEGPSIEVTYEDVEYDDLRAILTVEGTAGNDQIGVFVRLDDEESAVVTSAEGGTVTTSSPECVQLDPRTVECPGDVTGLFVRLGAGADVYNQYTREGVWRGEVEAGKGDDHLRVTFLDRPVDDEDGFSAVGGPGDDRIVDSSAVFGFFPQPRTYFAGGPGADRMVDGFSMDGGLGADRVGSYYRRNESRLLGGPGADRLVSHQGDDSLAGGAGADVLGDQGGDDVIYGGVGRDLVRVRDGGRDDVHCGAGRDGVVYDWRDFLVKCESALS